MQKSRTVVTSTACPVTATAPVTVQCPTFTTRTITPGITAAVQPSIESISAQLAAQLPQIQAVQPTDALQTDLMSLLSQIGGLGALAAQPTAAQVAAALPTPNATQQVFSNPLTQLGALSPFAALAAANPSAALASLSPSLNIFNPAVNPNAALLQFNPASASTLALSGLQGAATLPFGKPFGKFGKPFGKFGKPFGKFGKPFGKSGKPFGI